MCTGLRIDSYRFSVRNALMQIEVEAKFLNIDRDEMRRKLSAVGFTCIRPNFLMRRVVFDVPGHDFNTWGRVRDEGDKITMTIKRTNDEKSITGTEEIEVIIDDFEAGVKLLEGCGLVRKAYQETWREKWQRDGVEVVLDEWPAIEPFCEIEGPDEEIVRTVAAQLGFNWSDAMFGAVGAVYKRIGIDPKIINSHPVITFDNVDEIFGLKAG